MELKRQNARRAGLLLCLAFAPALYAFVGTRCEPGGLSRGRWLRAEEKQTGHQVKNAGNFKMDPEEMALQDRVRAHQEAAPKLDAATEVRSLVQYNHGFAVMSTNSASMPGYPGGSVVGFAVDDVGRPLFSFSSMSSHTQDLINSDIDLTMSKSNKQRERTRDSPSSLTMTLSTHISTKDIKLSSLTIFASSTVNEATDDFYFDTATLREGLSNTASLVSSSSSPTFSTPAGLQFATTTLSQSYSFRHSAKDSTPAVRGTHSMQRIQATRASQQLFISSNVIESVVTDDFYYNTVNLATQFASTASMVVLSSRPALSTAGDLHFSTPTLSLRYSFRQTGKDFTSTTLTGSREMLSFTQNRATKTSEQRLSSSNSTGFEVSDDVYSNKVILSSHFTSAHAVSMVTLSSGPALPTSDGLFHSGNTSSFTKEATERSKRETQKIQPTKTSQQIMLSSDASDSKGSGRNYSWSNWSSWSTCTKPCGSGLRVRTRACVDNSTRKNDHECNGANNDVTNCNAHLCQVVPLSVEAKMTKEIWSDSLFDKNSVTFRRLEAKLKSNIEKLYADSSKLLNVILNHCRNGSVIANFTVIFKAVDSHEILTFMEISEKDGRLAELAISSVSLSAVGIPNRTPNITKIYLTSANSFKVFWVSPGDEPIHGYRVAYRPLKGGREWSTLAVDDQTLSLHLKNLLEGIVYTVRVLAFNGNGNGIPGEAKEIKMEEGVPKEAPSVYVSDMMDSSTLSISWKAIPEEHVMGGLLGYHVMYKPVKKADKPIKENARVTTVTVDYPGKLHTRLKGLESFTSYSIRVAGFTAKGDGISSPRVTGETCPCPKVLYTNWAELPPYVTKPVNSHSPHGIIGTLVEEMLLKSCSICINGYGRTVLNFTNNGKESVAYKRTINSVSEDVDHRTQVSFPIIGALDDARFQREYVFVPLVESPGIAFITVSQHTSGTSTISTIVQYLPLYLFCLTMAFVAGIIVWALDSSWKSDGFSQSFTKGAGEGFWFSFISMTTVGYGDKVPVGVCARLFAVVWIITGLVMASILVGVIATSLTFSTLDKEIILYGTKVTALAESPAHKLGVRTNALVKPRDTLQESYKSLEQGEVKGLLLDAYVAGSQMKDLSQQLRVKEVIKLSKGIGVVLSGEAIKLQSRVRDYITDNAGKITKIIENSTTPLEQPGKSEAEEKATELFSTNSSLFHQTLMALTKALGGAVFCGIIWDLVCIGMGRRKKIHPGSQTKGDPSPKTKRKELQEPVQQFYDNFREVYFDLRHKYRKELQQHCQQQPQRKQKRKIAWR